MILKGVPIATFRLPSIPVPQRGSGVPVGVKVSVEVGVSVDVGVSVGVGVLDGVAVSVAGVGVREAVGVLDEVGVREAVGVLDEVGVFEGVFVNVGVIDGVRDDVLVKV